MSSSAAPLGATSQSYLRDPQYWDPFTPHTSGPTTHSSTPVAARQQRQDFQDSYVARWIADAAAAQNSRARNFAVGQQQQDNGVGYSSVAYNDYKGLNGLDTKLDRLAIQPQNHWPPVERAHRSMSPEAAMKQSGMVRRNSTDAAAEAIASYLQIPLSVNASKGSLADLAAQITCLFWFEPVSVLNKVEDAVGSPHTSALSHEAIPTIGFRKWVTTLLSTTQVSQNVILLSLLFIYRLKKITKNVQGKVGSEYRLLTVALMLGNKFLDDNTYTNKTWADVSGISVSEIHIMEVEFLSNMKYNLFTSASMWDSWHILLGKFSNYFDEASKMYSAAPTVVGMPALPPQIGGQAALPFTPPSEQVSPTVGISQRSAVPLRQLPNPLANFMSSGMPPTAHRLHEADMKPTELRAAGSRPVSRKRSYDLTNWEPPQKVARTSGLGQDITSTLSSSVMPTPDPGFPRLPMPGSSIPGSAYSAPYSGSVTTLPAAPLTLPAPAMMTPESIWHTPTEAHASTPVGPSHMPSLPALFTQHQAPSPYHHHLPRCDAHDVSPTNTSFANTPQQTQSPSGFLMYRNSPYRPVRQVNTLLAPPPSASVQNPMQHMSQQNPYYQPLSKGPIEPRQGMIPYLTPRQFQMAPVFDSSRQIPSFDHRQLFAPRQ